MGLSSKWWQILQVVEDEMDRARSGGFVVAHPTPAGASHYTSLYRSSRYSDHLLARWIEIGGSAGGGAQYLPAGGSKGINLPTVGSKLDDAYPFTPSRPRSALSHYSSFSGQNVSSERKLLSNDLDTIQTQLQNVSLKVQSPHIYGDKQSSSALLADGLEDYIRSSIEEKKKRVPSLSLPPISTDSYAKPSHKKAAQSEIVNMTSVTPKSMRYAHGGGLSSSEYRHVSDEGFEFSHPVTSSKSARG